MLPNVLIVILVAFALLVVLIAMRPSVFRVERTALLSCPPPVVFAHVNDFHNWQAWSPWEKLDPAMKRTYEGAPYGIGAVYMWSGNRQVGEGRSTITESRPSELIRIKLEFMKPFKCTNIAEFTFRPQGSQTAVTWALDGRYNFVTKALCLVMSMDKMLGGQFEKGLSQLKTVAESAQRV